MLRKVAIKLRLTEEEMHSELAALMYVNEVVDGEGLMLYIDRVVSMSALAEAEDTFMCEFFRDPFSVGDPHGS